MSKAGVHYLGTGPDPALAAARVIKFVDVTPPALPSGVTALWRWVEPFDPVNDWMPNKTPEQAAHDWIALQRPRFASMPHSVYIEGPNEPTVFTAAQAEWFSDFEITRMGNMEILGWRCCIGNFPTGRPPLGSDDNWATWRAFLPALRYAARNGHLLGLHEYGYSIDSWNMGRWRRVYDWLPADAQPDFVISEWGVDGDRGRYRDGAVSDQGYMDLIAAYDARLSAHPKARGFTIFTRGTNGDSAWDPFEITPLIGKLAAYLSQTPARPAEEQPPMADKFPYKAKVTKTVNVRDRDGVYRGAQLQPGDVVTVVGEHLDPANGVRADLGNVWLTNLEKAGPPNP